MLTVYLVRRNGNMPVVLAQIRLTISVIALLNSQITHGLLIIPISDLNPLDRKFLILGDSTKCTAAYGNGARMLGTIILRAHLRMVQLGLREIRGGACGRAAHGVTRQNYVAQQVVIGIGKAIATMTSVFV
jgi:hypothetical protein